MTDAPHLDVRIPVRPQRWLFAVNLVVQPAMSALFVLIAVNGELGGAIFGGVMALVTLLLFGFSVLVVARTWGKTFEIVVAETLEIPNLLTGHIDRVAMTSVQSAQVMETKARGVSFYSLTLALVEPARRRSLVISSQLVGRDAFTRFREALAARGIPIV